MAGKGIHFSTITEGWERCRAATEESCPYEESHHEAWIPPEEGAPTREEYLEAEREAKAVKKALSREKAKARNRRNVAAWRARQRAKEAATGGVNPREVEALGELSRGVGEAGEVAA